MKRTHFFVLLVVMAMLMVSCPNDSPSKDEILPPPPPTVFTLTFTVIDDSSYSVSGYTGAEPTDLVIPSTHNGKTVTSIGDSAFTNCYTLTSVIIPDSIISIGSNAFSSCSSLATVTIDGTIASGITDISSFGNLVSNASIIYVKTGISVGSYITAKFSKSPDTDKVGYDKYVIVDSDLVLVLIDGDANYSVTGYTGDSTNLIIPDTYNNKPVTSIGVNAFKDNTTLTTITIPASVTIIESDAFTGCSNLATVTIDGAIASGITDITSFGNLVSNASILYVKIGISVGSYITANFSKPPNTDKVGYDKYIEVDPALVFTLSGETYSLTGYTGDSTNLIIPSIYNNKPVTSIGVNAFKDNTTLRSITIPDSITIIESGAFTGCSSLATVTIDGTIASGITAETSFGNLVSNASIIYVKTGISVGNYITANCIKQSTSDKVGYDKYVIVDSDLVFMLIDGDANYSVTGYTGDSTNLIIPDTYNSKPVTGIGVNAFKDNTTLKSITIPDSITSIESDAFTGCSSLATVTIDGTIASGITDITSFGNLVSNATMIYVKTGISVGSYIAANFSKPPDTDKVGYDKYIEGDPFFVFTLTGETYSLTSYTGTAASLIIPSIYNNKAVTSIGDFVFKNCYLLTSVSIPEGVTSIGDSAFDSTSLTSVDIPEGVTSIGDFAFASTSLTSVDIPEGVTSIGDSAFANCYTLTSVIIPDSVTSMGTFVFQYCSSLSSITVGRGNVAYSSSDAGVLFNKDKNILLKHPEGKTNTSYTIPTGVTRIEQGAFANCSSLISVDIPEGVTFIGAAAFDSTGLTSVDIPEGVTFIGTYAFNASALTSVSIPNTVTHIRSGTFSLCESLTNVTIPNSVTSIGDGAFSSSGLTSVVIGNGVTSIGKSAFGGTGLTSVTIPNSVTSISPSAFSGCSSLTEVVIDSPTIASGSKFGDLVKYATTVYIKKELTTGAILGGFAKTSSDKQGYDKYTETEFGFTLNDNNSYSLIKYNGSATSVVIPGTYDGKPVTSIGRDVFENNTTLTNVTIPNSVTSIEYSAFRGCSGLTSIVIPEGVTSIGMYAFYGCSSLTSIVIPEGVTSIGRGTFSASGLTSIVIPDSVTRIEDEAFYDCRSLISIVIPKGVTYIETSTFSGCSSLTSIIIPEGVTSIGMYAFSGCSSLTSIVIPEGVTSIGGAAFLGCSGLTSVDIPTSVTNIEQQAFDGCSNLTSVSIPNSVTSIEYLAFLDCSSLATVTIDSPTIAGGANVGNLVSNTATKTVYINDTLTIGTIVSEFTEQVVTGTDPAGYKKYTTWIPEHVTRIMGQKLVEILVFLLHRRVLCL